MSYLDVPRLHFTGAFWTDPSTVNNIASFYEPDSGSPFENNPPNWNWNPYGSHSWVFVGCRVVSAVYADGTVVETWDADPIIGTPVRHAGASTVKLAGLDVLQQYLPSLWGLELRVGHYGTEDGFVGPMSHVAARDQWYRDNDAPKDSAGGDFNNSGRFQSVIEAPRWDGNFGSPFVKQLREASPDRLSVNMIVDGFHGKPAPDDPFYMMGRVVGSIGPSGADEPDHIVADRRLRSKPGSTIWKGTPLYFAPFRVDEARKKVIVDLGNSLPRTAKGVGPEPLGTLELAILRPDGPPEVLGEVAYMGREYERTGQIQEFDLTNAQLEVVRSTPLAVGRSTGFHWETLLAEDSEGRMALADQFVYRLDPGEAATVEIYATRFGRPAADEVIRLSVDAECIAQYQLLHPELPDGTVIDVLPGTAADGVLDFPDEVVTDGAGRAEVPLAAVNPPARPRLDGAIDGQIYGVAYTLPGLENPNPHDYVSVRVFDAVDIPDVPTWVADVGPILRKFADMYPAMRYVMDIGDYEVVKANADDVCAALSRDVESADYMPVHRELSAGKLRLIMRWMDTEMVYE